MPPALSGKLVRLLKDGYWDRTAVIGMPDSSQRVRKQCKPVGPDKIWGVESLRREIHYLQNQPAQADPVFPPVLDSWDTVSAEGTTDIGYDLPFYPQHADAGSLARDNVLAQSEIDSFQTHLADAMLRHVHLLVIDSPPLSGHFREVATHTFAGLLKDPALVTLIEAPEIQLNGQSSLGPRAAWQHIVEQTDGLKSLDAVPRVQIHGDFFLENILWASAPPADNTPALVLIDPVSVAGLSAAPPVFDLVKYESYATGELLALRSEWVEVSGFESANDALVFENTIQWDHPGLIPYRTKNWHRRFHERFVAHHGPINRMHYHLIDGYFSLAMALNTDGIQRRARLLKATREFNDVLAHLT